MELISFIINGRAVVMARQIREREIRAYGTGGKVESRTNHHPDNGWVIRPPPPSLELEGGKTLALICARIGQSNGPNHGLGRWQPSKTDTLPAYNLQGALRQLQRVLEESRRGWGG